MARRRRYDDYDDFEDHGGWPRYVPVAERRAQAAAEVEALREEGEDIQPVEIEGRLIARSFWGKGWYTHLESFSDYSNRLPRGRSYVRNGSVCHLGIEKGKVEAMVSGSELYRVTVDIVPLKKAKWTTLKNKCTGQIGSLIELLQGNLSEEIMNTVIDRKHGLFPAPAEINYQCNCPDWADMCKHIAAVMYGIGARLDDQPELLFLLRGVDHQDLISADASAEVIAGRGSARSRRRALSGDALENVFGVELEETTEPVRRPAPAKAFKPTARNIAALRRRLAMSKSEFARAVGVSVPTITNWEKAKGKIHIQARGLEGLERLNAR